MRMKVSRNTCNMLVFNDRLAKWFMIDVFIKRRCLETNVSTNELAYGAREAEKI